LSFVDAFVKDHGWRIEKYEFAIVFRCVQVRSSEVKLVQVRSSEFKCV